MHMKDQLMTPRPSRSPASRAQECLAKNAFSAVPLLLCGLLNCKNVDDLAQASAATSSPSNYVIPRQPQKARADRDYSTGYTRGCPEWMVRVGSAPDYCISRFEAHVAELQLGKEVPHFPSSRPKKGMRLIAKLSPDSLPQSSIDRAQSIQACESAGFRLCSMAEWKHACMGAGATTYPYGDEEVKGECNTGKPHLLSVFHGADPGKWSKDDMNDPVLNVVKGFLEKPGFRSRCVSSYGAYDMVGNLHEWVTDLVDQRMIDSMPYIGKKKPGKNAPRPAVGNGIFMGGFFGSENQNGRGCNYATIAHGPDHYDYSVGFRCCADAVDD